MRRKEFLEHLSRTPRKWRLRDGDIRSESFDDSYGYLVNHCPISAVVSLITKEHSEAGEGADTDTWDAIGLNHAVASQIVAAADDKGCPKTRQELLKACGLEVTP